MHRDAHSHAVLDCHFEMTMLKAKATGLHARLPRLIRWNDLNGWVTEKEQAKLMARARTRLAARLNSSQTQSRP